MWLEPATVRRLAESVDAEFEAAARRATAAVIRMLVPDLRKAISCPVCSVALRRLAIPETEIHVDVCDAHGTWFDQGEVTKYTEAYAAARAGELTAEDLEAAGVHGSPAGGFWAKVRQLFGSDEE
jgi:Zn-finger nucleic acid-binding protein